MSRRIVIGVMNIVLLAVALMPSFAQDVQGIADKAQSLSITPGHLSEAIREYRRALAINPSDHSARIGLARTLSWNGQNIEAVAIYDAMLAENQNDTEALLGRAQVARWAGDRRAASRLIQKAIAIAPQNPRLLAELAQVDLSLRRRTQAWDAIRRARQSAPDAYETHEAVNAFDAATRASLHLKTTYSEESTPFRRFNEIMRGEFYPLPDTRLRPEVVYTRFSDNTTSIKRETAGISARQNLPLGLYGDGIFRYHRIEHAEHTNEYSGELGGHPLDGPIEIRGGWRKHAIVDLPAGYENIAYMEGAGSGGSTLSSIVNHTQIKEGFTGGSFSPFSSLYLYGDGAWGTIDDGNSRRSIAAGTGLNLMQLFNISSIYSVTAKFDFYDLRFRQVSSNYYSPDLLRVYTPGLGWRINLSKATVGLDGGRSFFNNKKMGYVAAGFFQVKPTNHIAISGRAEFNETAAYSIKSGTLDLAILF